MNINSRQLKSFLLVARHRNFSRAAEQLFITQSGLSVLVRELEGQLGFRLFERTTRRVGLTEFGTQFLPVAERYMQDLEAAVSRIGRSASAASRYLSVGATPLMAAHLLPAVIAEFGARNRELRIRLFDADRSTISDLVEGGKLDMGLGMFLKPATGVRRISLFRFSLVAISAGEASPSRIQRVGWSTLVASTLIGLPPDNPIQQLIERHLFRAGRRNPPDLVFNYLETQIAMAEVGAGTAILPSFALPACRNRKVLINQVVKPIVHLDLYEIRNRGIKLPPGADEFTAFLREYVASWAHRAGLL